ncbi:MAG: hypothetical protein WC789_07825 [Lentisphaeria bacterium]|jgi:hypothetical protein
MRFHLLVLAAGLWLAGAATAAAQNPTLAWGEPWNAWFAGRATEFTLAAGTPEAMTVRLEWELRREGELLASGSEWPLGLMPTMTRTLRFTADLPAVRGPGAVPLALTVRLFDEGNVERATATRVINAFAPDPFRGRDDWLRGLRLVLYDPDGATGQRFDKAGIPYREHKGLVAGLAEYVASVIVVGAGSSPEDLPQLYPALRQAAMKGCVILWLTPGAGSFPLPDATGNEFSRPARLTFRQIDFIRELDRRLDSGLWAGGIRPISVSVRIACQEEGAPPVCELRSPPAADGWPWAEFAWPSGGRLILCGTPIIEAWESGPCPSYLLAALLESLDASRARRTSRGE